MTSEKRINTMRLQPMIIVLMLGAALPLPGFAQRLGTIEFPNSGAAAAQTPFINGMLLLHSFEYSDAAKEFRDAQKLDPTFALAYAGEALTYTHPVWNEQDTGSARAALARLSPLAAQRRNLARTPREQMYMDAVEILYGSGTKPQRDTLFSAAIERIVAAYPDDDEAKIFFALSLLGLNQSVRDIPDYMRAGAIAEDVLRRKPDHPGAAHFVIHAFDDPIHAPLGLWAANAYSKIAPQAAHAQHMTSHIFLAMGMWDKVVSQNVIASGSDHASWHAGHYTVWLGYGYQQQGRFSEARSHLRHLHGNVGDSLRRGEAFSLIVMRAAYLIDTEDWKDSSAKWTFARPQSAQLRAIDGFALAYTALKTGDRVGAERITKAIEAELSPGVTGLPAAQRAVIQILATELRAAISAADGHFENAVSTVREATRLEDALPLEFGPPLIAKPTHELAGEILLAAGKPADAQSEFVKALALAPGRSRSLLGLARAASRAGDNVTATRAARDLLKNWHSADSSISERSEMQRLSDGAP